MAWPQLGRPEIPPELRCIRKNDDIEGEAV